MVWRMSCCLLVLGRIRLFGWNKDGFGYYTGPFDELCFRCISTTAIVIPISRLPETTPIRRRASRQRPCCTTKQNERMDKQASNRTRTKPSHLQFEPSNWRFSSHSWVLSLVVRERLRTCSPSSPRPVVLVTKFLVYLDSSMSFTFCVIFLFSHKERDNENFRENWVAAWSGGRGFRNEYKQIQWKS